MLSTAARRAASIAFHRTASGKATRRQLKYQRTSKGKAMNIAARRRMSDLMFPTGKIVFFIKRVPLDPCQGPPPGRSEERRVGEEGVSTCRSVGTSYHNKTKKQQL